MGTLMIEHANAMPAPTWHRLGVNDVDIELPDDLAFARQVEVQCAEGLLGDEGAFDAALLSMADSFPVAATPSAAAGDLGEQPAMRAADHLPMAAQGLRDQPVACAADQGLSPVEPASVPTSAAHQVDDPAAPPAAMEDGTTAMEGEAAAL